MKTIQKPYKKLILALCLCIFCTWSLFSTGASLAWFSDTSPKVKNIFHFAEFDLVVSHRLEDGTYEEIDSQTKIFDEEALYEPGYVQVVYLKIENKGTVPFDFQTAVNVTDYTVATNVFGNSFLLQDYLKFGLVTADTEAELEQMLKNRKLAEEEATMPLNKYETDTAELAAKGTQYMALIVRMPPEVNNEANYRGDVVPTVELGLIVNATQQQD